MEEHIGGDKPTTIAFSVVMNQATNEPLNHSPPRIHLERCEIGFAEDTHAAENDEAAAQRLGEGGDNEHIDACMHMYGVKVHSYNKNEFGRAA